MVPAGVRDQYITKNKRYSFIHIGSIQREEVQTTEAHALLGNHLKNVVNESASATQAVTADHCEMSPINICVKNRVIAKRILK
jgi:hypothetical protein